MAFGPNLAPNLEAKALPKWSQVGSEIDQKLSQDVDHLFVGLLIALGTFFLQFDLEVGGPRGPKIIETHRFFYTFCYLGQLANKRLYDGFFGQLGLQLEAQNPPKFNPRGFQNRSKRVKKT